MDEFKISIDHDSLNQSCKDLKSAGIELEGKLGVSINVGELSGMPGVESLIAAYKLLQDTYRKLAQLAKKDADDIKNIGDNFHELDKSADPQ